MSQQHVAPVTFRKATRLAVGRDRALNLIEILLDPLVLVFSLWVVALVIDGEVGARHVILTVIVFALTFPGPAYLARSPGSVARHIVLSWVVIFGLLFAFGYASGFLKYFNLDLLIVWCFAAPSCQFGAHFLLRLAAPAIIALQGDSRRAVVAGVNGQGIELVQRLASDPYSRVRVLGFFDDRTDDRVTRRGEYPLLGKIAGLPEFVKRNHTDIIYISLPMASQPRILSLLEQLRDTTASIYFVPDIFVTDLIQGRVDSVGGLPIVAVCESPFAGFGGVVKRASDIVFSLLILALVSAPMLIIALAVKCTSPGAVIFRQRRYGVDGREIIVYKFRTMTVSEDGATIQQARVGDERVTPVGGWLRKYSLDELPQLFNVLQGRMSIVGPRPHAVAHNEMYRKLIKGYMLRHKVKPGITGWAQVNGLRGETNTLDKMKTRIEYDLNYLRNWTLRFDLYIMVRTIWVVFFKGDAY